MENDDKLKAFFKEHAQPLRREVWFSRRIDYPEKPDGKYELLR